MKVWPFLNSGQRFCTEVPAVVKPPMADRWTQDLYWPLGAFNLRFDQGEAPSAEGAALGNHTSVCHYSSRSFALVICSSQRLEQITKPSYGNYFNMKNKLTTAIFFNHCFDKRRFQNFLYWFFKKSYFGQLRSQPPKRKLLKFLERLKFLGFHSATQAGFSISIDDLKIPSSKSEILLTAENIVLEADLQLISGNLTIIERYQRIIEIWNRTSEELKYQVLQSFKISDFLNPVYLMAFSGARGNISQIRQLVGMRGLMADPQGQIIDFPIRSNFREGLTLTEYLISCSGARKGIVDTALRTAASGYLTRRLVDVAHHVVVHQMDCQQAPQGPRPRGIWIEDLYDQQKKYYLYNNV